MENHKPNNYQFDFQKILFHTRNSNPKNLFIEKKYFLENKKKFYMVDGIYIFSVNPFA